MQDRTWVGENGALWRTAQALNRAAHLRKPLPPLLFFTDPQRTPDPVTIARRLPAGAGIVFRSFGRGDAEPRAHELAQVSKDRGLTLLIGLDPDLAERCGAHGVHLPERALSAAAALKQRRPDWILTGAAHGAAALTAPDLDAAVLSPVFASASPSAGAALGVEGFAALTAAARLPVYALGGIRGDNARGLEGSGAVGLAAIDGVLEAFGP
jgi:thiamine-phosphate pyrophosphorylase